MADLAYESAVAIAAEVVVSVATSSTRMNFIMAALAGIDEVLTPTLGSHDAGQN